MSLIKEFLLESNAIEREYSEDAYTDARIAWDFMSNSPMNLKSILETHRILTRRLLLPNESGHVRTCDVFIGGHRKIYISQQLLEEEITGWCKEYTVGNLLFEKYNDGIYDEDKSAFAKQMHVSFEKIHPFVDGNGRVGRILWAVHRDRLGLPIEIIHGWKQIEKQYHPEQKEYYSWFK